MSESQRGVIGHARTASRDDESLVPGTRALLPADELVQALTRLAEAIEHQAQSIDALLQVIGPQYVEEGEEGEEATADRYLDGTPIKG